MSDIWLVAIGVLDYMRNGTINRFQIIILIFVIYALTAGKKDFKRLDRWIQKKISRWKGNPESKFDEPQSLNNKDHARSQRRKFYIHLIIFVALQVVFILFTDYNLSSIPELIHKLDSIDSDNSNQVMEIMSGVSGISLIWTISIFIHFIISFFP
ncbi:hypothetical protein [Oceanobacillus kapialis]|uniref:hypothetical protein n=1 Tax=Oceanobacillus kapialis TaxID=481353 RepID=UPI00384C833A